MKSASNRGILNGRLQVLYIHVLFVAHLGAGHMAQPGTEQHEHREAARHTGATVDLPTHPLNHIIGAIAGPVFTGEIAIGFLLHRLVPIP